MKRMVVCFLLSVLIALPSAASAAVKLGAGWGITSFQSDLDFINSGPSFSLEAVIGTGTISMLLGGLWSSHDSNIDYQSFMAGPVWSVGGARIYAALSNHEVDNAGTINDGWGVTVGGGAGWKVAPLTSLLLDVKMSNWEGDNSTKVGTGTLQLLFQMGF